ncbi:MAG: beta-lactamase family protein [Ruminiclostridium sp.]|nr:beta-lactamase family protein [Ruminiclostridium sp.]
MKRIIARSIAALCASALFAVPVCAEDTGYVLPSGITAGDFGSALEKLENDSKTPFASAEVGVFKGGDVLYTGNFGYTDIENGIAADENSVYEWGSISKTFVWVSAMQLWERGQLDLGADIRTYLPEGFFRHLSYDDPITFMDLMNHSAGWQETMRQIETSDESTVLPLKEALQACEPAQIHRPGEVTAYSNYGAALAGYVVECVSGTDYCEYVHENILEPLGMSHTSVDPTHSDNPWVKEQRRKLKCYRADPISGKMTDLGNRLDYIMPYPAGAVTGTLADLMTYGQALVNDDAPLFLHKETQDKLFEGTSFRGSSDIPSCCHGFWAEEYGVRTYGHSGATNAGQANLIFDPVSKTGLAVMINEPDGNAFLYNTPELVFGKLTPDRFTAGGTADTRLTGYYTMSRSTYRGLFRFMPYLTALSLDEPAYDIGNGVYLIGDENGMQMLSDKIYPDGTRALGYGSMDLIRDDGYITELLLLALYVVLAVAALYFIRVRRKLKKHGRREAYSGSAAMTAGNIALVVSAVTWLGSYVMYCASGSGMTFGSGAALGVIQMICAAVCSVSAVTSVISTACGKNKAPAHIYILNTLMNTTAVAAVMYYEMYVFWGC